MERPFWSPLAVTAAKLLLPVALFSIGGLSCNRVKDPEYCDDGENKCRDPNSLCDLVLHECVTLMPGQCRDDADCPTVQRAQCDRRTSTCVPCVPPEDMSMPAGACAHLGKSYCVKQGAGNTCVECLGNMDCSADKPICDGNACRPCREHKECGPDVLCEDPTDKTGRAGKPCTNSWVCIGPDDGDDLSDRKGRCAYNSGTTSRVVYAWNFKMMNNQCDDKWPGTASMPVCSLDAAVELARGNSQIRYVRLLEQFFDPLTAPIGASGSVRLVIIGAETKSMPMRATVRGKQTLFQVVSGSSLTLDQLNLIEDMPNTIALSCVSTDMTKPASLTLRRSSVLSSVMPSGIRAAINVSDCDTTLVQNYIGAMSDTQPGHAAGIQLSDSSARSYRVEGNLIAGNLGTGLLLVNVTKLQARFNTIVNNSVGVNCVGSGPTLGQSIVFNNNTSQIMGCTLDSVVTDDPKLDKRFHLTKDSVSCIDKVPAGANLPDRDIDGDPRPLGAAFDIGADEFRPN